MALVASDLAPANWGASAPIGLAAATRTLRYLEAICPVVTPASALADRSAPGSGTDSGETLTPRRSARALSSVDHRISATLSDSRRNVAERLGDRSRQGGRPQGPGRGGGSRARGTPIWAGAQAKSTRVAHWCPDRTPR